MGLKNWFFAVVSASFALASQGCVISVNDRVDTYDRCALGESCYNSFCTLASTTTNPTGAVGAFCTSSCFSSSDCPASPDGAPVSCVTTASGGQCYRLCDPGNLCPGGFTCGGPSGMQPFCIPSA
jgi:hypothetical protein